MVYIQDLWQANHEVYDHIRCTYTVLANPIDITHITNPFSPAVPLIAFARAQSRTHTHVYTRIHTHIHAGMTMKTRRIQRRRAALQGPTMIMPRAKGASRWGRERGHRPSQSHRLSCSLQRTSLCGSMRWTRSCKCVFMVWVWVWVWVWVCVCMCVCLSVCVCLCVVCRVRGDPVILLAYNVICYMSYYADPAKYDNFSFFGRRLTCCRHNLNKWRGSLG